MLVDEGKPRDLAHLFNASKSVIERVFNKYMIGWFLSIPNSCSSSTGIQLGLINHLAGIIIKM
jgi:hypothetical protein